MRQMNNVPRVNKRKRLNLIFYFIASFAKLPGDFISEINNLKYAFNIPFKITLKTIIK